MELLNRTEALTVKKDISKMAKAMEVIAAKLPEKIISGEGELISDESDQFFGKLHISDKHLVAIQGEYSCNMPMYEVGLMEEVSELIQALSKHLRGCESLDNIIEEMAHTLICIRLVSYSLGISPEDVQKEIMKKYPQGYVEGEER